MDSRVGEWHCQLPVRLASTLRLARVSQRSGRHAKGQEAKGRLLASRRRVGWNGSRL